MHSLEFRPRNIIIIIADSLRFDTVFGDGDIGMPYLQSHAKTFLNTRSSGCWTLPSTASLFTGLAPHEHGATTQTRAIDQSTTTLAQHLKAMGYCTIQITANAATTEIFGLHRGFDQILKIWNHIPYAFPGLIKSLVLFGKPRLRRILFSKDVLTHKFSEDLKAGAGWLQQTYRHSFRLAQSILDKNKEKGKSTFLFINLMETHFPFHIDTSFKLLSEGIFARIKEMQALFQLVNQSFLRNEQAPQTLRRYIELLRKRQQSSWDLIKKDLDAFVSDLHQQDNNLIVFASDHGENFGDQGWYYHFSNVTEAGTKVPLFWLDNEDKSPDIFTGPSNLKNVYHSILNKCSARYTSEKSVMSSGYENLPISESFWYDNQGKTLPKYRHNQFSFIVEDLKFIKRNENWFFQNIAAPPPSALTPFEKNSNPVEELSLSGEEREYLRKQIRGFDSFSQNL